MRPVAEMQFADFVSCAWDHLVTVAAKQHYRTGISVPIVVRLPERRRLLRRPVPLAEPRVQLRARAGPQDRLPVHAGRRQGPAARRAGRPEPGALLRAQAPVPPPQGRCARGPRAHRVRPRAGAPPRRRRDGRDLGRDGAHGARRRRAPGRRRTAVEVEVLDLRTILPWDREAVLESVAHVAPARAARGHPHGRLRRGDRRHRRRRGLQRPRRARCAAWPRPTRPSRSRRPWSGASCPASTTSWPSCASSSSGNAD